MVTNASSEEHMFSNRIQEYQPSWPLILQAWHYIFRLKFFGGTNTAAWCQISIVDCHAAFPSLVAYAMRKYLDQQEPLLVLVGPVCCALEEVRQQRDQGDAHHIQEDNSFGNQAILDIDKQI